MEQRLYIKVDGGSGGGAKITAQLDGVLFFEAIGSAPDNLTYDIYIGSIQTNNGFLDLLVTPPATTTSTLVISLSGALNENVNVPAPSGGTGAGYNAFERSIPIGEHAQPASPDLDRYFEILSDAYFSGKSIIVTGSNGGHIKIKSWPAANKFVFTVNAVEFKPYNFNQFFICKSGSSGFGQYVSGVPTVHYNINGVYYNVLGTRETYAGDLTFLSGMGSSHANDIWLGAGTWLVNDIADPETDPYKPAGISGTGGGGGKFDLSSDAVDFPALPTLNAVSTGLVSVYTPSLSQLNALANFMWNANPTDVDFWKKLVANPLDLILGLSIVPVQVPAGASQNIKVGLVDTGISMARASTQFAEVDCGSIQVDEFFGSALDYSPFRRFSIYLPFIGTRTISTDDIMGKPVHVKYHIDLLSGAAVAMVKCGNAVLYQYSGACAVSLPLSGETFTNVITSTIQLAASIGATVATGGAAAGVTAASAANSLMSMKPIVERAGGVSGAAGQLGIMRPYLIGEVPRQSVPDDCNKFMGYPSNMKAVIGDLTGYTEVEIIHLHGIEATQVELDELESVLKGGFII